VIRIAITADPYLPVPPELYGGIERIVDLLARGLAERGHEITVFAHPGSRTAGRLVPYGSPPHVGWRHRGLELLQLGAGLWTRRRGFDLIHSFGRLRALLPVLPQHGLAKIQSYQRGVPWRGVSLAAAIAGDSLRFTACSDSMYRNPPVHGRAAGRWHTVFNAVDQAKYCFVDRVAPDAPLVFLGRLDPIKGAHLAIEIARAAGRRLIIAGNRVDDFGYFDDQIAPHLDTRWVSYIGAVNDAQKNALLGRAAALLMPVLWEEPFGIVMAEAFACGTPVIGFERGSLPEVVRDGVNGYLAASVAEAAAAVGSLGRIDRATVRADAEARFSRHAMVDAYEQLYREALR
jgi:glycosyltransferase involved in cell wall biosynthesis